MAETTTPIDGNAIVYCEGAFDTPNGKTAHGLVRRTARYRVLSVLDSRHAGKDAGAVLDRRAAGIPVLAGLDEALAAAREAGNPATHFVVGLAPDGGRLPAAARETIAAAIRARLHVDSGLHDYLSEDERFVALAREHGVRLRDIRRTPPRAELHGFSGAIDRVAATRIALLGTDSAVGKRTTAWLLVEALRERGRTAEMIGTGQTAWLQGVRYGIILDSLINDFVAGEIEHAIVRCADEVGPDVMVLEGQGSLMNPAYPGGFELLAAGRPHGVVMQHAPARREYDGFPGFPMHPLPRQIEAVELIGERPVIAVAVNHEGLDTDATREVCRRIEAETGLPTVDPLLDGAGRLAEAVEALR